MAAYYAPAAAAQISAATTADPQRVITKRSFASAALFPLLGVQPILGRTYSADEDQPGHNQVALISYGLWRSFFSSDPNVVGKTMRMNSRPYTVTGVLPDGFDFAGDNQI